MYRGLFIVCFGCGLAESRTRYKEYNTFMPELPEVETVRRQLSKYVVGKKIEAVEVFKLKSWQGDIAQVVGKKISGIDRRSKILRFELGKNINILVHLKMSEIFLPTTWAIS